MPRLARRAPEEAKQRMFRIRSQEEGREEAGEAASPEEERQGLPEVLEVVVMIYCRLVAQLNVSEHLRRAQGRLRNFVCQSLDTQEQEKQSDVDFTTQNITLYQTPHLLSEFSLTLTEKQ